MRSENLLARIGMEPIVPLKFKTCRAGTSHPQPGCFSFAAASKPNLAVPEARTGPRQSQEASGVPLSPASSRPLGRKLLFGTPASCRRVGRCKEIRPQTITDNCSTLSPSPIPRHASLSRVPPTDPPNRPTRYPHRILDFSSFPAIIFPTDTMASMPAATIHPQSHVGFDSITSQIERKLLKRGFQFNVICVGK